MRVRWGGVGRWVGDRVLKDWPSDLQEMKVKGTSDLILINESDSED